MTAKRHLDHRWALVPLILALAAALVGAPALAEGPETAATFTVDLAPEAVDGGVATTFTATLENTLGAEAAAEAALDTVSITAPAGFVVTWAGTPRVNGAKQGSAEVDGDTVTLTDLSAAPGAEVTLRLGAKTACEDGDHTWAATDPSGAFALDGRNSSLAVGVDGCALAFADGPDDAEKDATISSERFDPGGEPVTVVVENVHGKRVRWAEPTVTVAIKDNPAQGSLSGTDEQEAVKGLATFNDLAIDRAGLDYTLQATAPGIDRGVSEPFNVYDDVCDEGEACEVGDGDTAEQGMRSEARGAGRAGGGGMIVALGDDLPHCGDDFSHAPLATTLIGDDLEDKVVEIVVSEEERQADPDGGVGRYQVCAEVLDDESGFEDRDGVFVGEGEAGLLPDCRPRHRGTPPCVASKRALPGGAVSITINWGSRLRVF